MSIICIVVAMADTRVIGREGGLPWHLSSDLKFFKQVTMGHPVVMGRRTYESIGRPLPGRTNIVITRDPAYRVEGAVIVDSLDAAIAEAAAADGGDEVMIIGGGQIYAEALPMTDRIIMTEVHYNISGDTYFPQISEAEWHEVSRDDRSPEREGEPALSFVILERNGTADRS